MASHAPKTRHPVLSDSRAAVGDRAPGRVDAPRERPADRLRGERVSQPPDRVAEGTGQVDGRIPDADQGPREGVAAVERVSVVGEPLGPRRGVLLVQREQRHRFRGQQGHIRGGERWVKLDDNSGGAEGFVSEPARFDSPSKNVSTKRGKSAILQCHVYGDSPIDITWTKDGTKLDLNSYRYDGT